MAVNLSPVGGVAAQFFTNNGAPLTGGKIFTYAAGTTTPAATYTSSNGATAWTNPIVLDSAGRVSGSGEIWLTDGLLYKFILKDANDVLIATYDNISGINSNFVAFVNQQEIVTATAGQTVFNLGISYQPGTNSLSVFVDGVNQYGPGAQYAYVETDADTVTFTSGLHVGAEVKFTTTQQQSAGAVDAEQVSYQPPFTGSVATNVEAKLAQTVSVFDFMSAAEILAVQTDDYTGVTYAQITSAIQACVTSFPVVSGRTYNMNIVFPSGTYRIDSAITFPAKLFYPKLSFEGQIIQTSATADGLVFDEVYYGTINGVNISTAWDSWANDRAGVKFNTLGHTILSIRWATNFQKGLWLNYTNAVNTATAYNTIYLDYLRDCKYGVYCTPNGGTNFINANTFHGGNFENTHLSTTSGDVGVYIAGPNFGNNFYNQIFESIHTGYGLTFSSGWTISNPYYEATDTWADISNSVNGTWINGHQPFSPTKFTTNAETKNITFINSGDSTTNAAALLISKTGIQFGEYLGGTASKNPFLTLSYNPNNTLNCVIATDHVGTVQFYNKSYQTATNAPPTLGTFAVGAMCWNSTGTNGQPSGWICTAAGTAGTLVGVTANATNGSPTVVVNDATNLFVGMYVNVAGGAYAPVQILSISGTTLTMAANSAATVTGAAVTYFAPTWKALANFA